jgi:hypothetical protein
VRVIDFIILEHSRRQDLSYIGCIVFADIAEVPSFLQWGLAGDRWRIFFDMREEASWKPQKTSAV